MSQDREDSEARVAMLWVQKPQFRVEQRRPAKAPTTGTGGKAQPARDSGDFLMAGP